LFVLGVRPGVHGDRAASGFVHRSGRDLDQDPALVGQGQRGGQGQLVDAVAADLFAGPQHDLEERGAGQQHGPGHHVPGQPWM
jgi:hypothetical protein